MSYPGHEVGCGCQLCWLAANDPAYRQLWGIDPPPPKRTAACLSLGKLKGEQRCDTCNGNVRRFVYECKHPDHGPETTIERCQACPGYVPKGEPMRPVRWAVGVTTVPARQRLLTDTLWNLAHGGFEEVRLFVDGCYGDLDDRRWYHGTGATGVTFREPPALGVVGNWVLGLWELYVRNPTAHRYAMFQDDLQCIKNLRGYLDRLRFPEKSYWNLFTFMDNEGGAVHGAKGTWFEGSRINGRGDQSGRGAVGLVFSREGVQALLASPSLVNKPAAATNPNRKLDGAVVTAMNRAGFRELCHAPSLLQHTGDVSIIGNHGQPKAGTFPGVNFDALTFLKPEEQPV